MKYYSEITKQKYDTVEALNEAEQNIKTQLAEKKDAAVSERKEAAKVVEKAFADASAKRKANAEKRAALDEKVREIDKKYRAEEAKLEKAKEEEFDALQDDYHALEKSDKESIEQAYEELRKFCKKYGTYHYSVDTAGAELFPMLMGFGQIEKTKSLIASLFDSAFGLF